MSPGERANRVHPLLPLLRVDAFQSFDERLPSSRSIVSSAFTVFIFFASLIAFDLVLHTLHKGAGRMAGDVDPLRPILQRCAKSASLPFRSVGPTLQPEQIGQPGADASAVPTDAIVVGAAREGVSVVKAFEGARHLY